VLRVQIALLVRHHLLAAIRVLSAPQVRRQFLAACVRHVPQVIRHQPLVVRPAHLVPLVRHQTWEDYVHLVQLANRHHLVGCVLLALQDRIRPLLVVLV